jgi:hypothetical protein
MLKVSISILAFIMLVHYKNVNAISIFGNKEDVRNSIVFSEENLSKLKSLVNKELIKRVEDNKEKMEEGMQRVFFNYQVLAETAKIIKYEFGTVTKCGDKSADFKDFKCNGNPLLAIKYNWSIQTTGVPVLSKTGIPKYDTVPNPWEITVLDENGNIHLVELDYEPSNIPDHFESKDTDFKSLKKNQIIKKEKEEEKVSRELPKQNIESNIKVDNDNANLEKALKSMAEQDEAKRIELDRLAGEKAALIAKNYAEKEAAEKAKQELIDKALAEKEAAAKAKEEEITKLKVAEMQKLGAKQAEIDKLVTERNKEIEEKARQVALAESADKAKVTIKQKINSSWFVSLANLGVTDSEIILSKNNNFKSIVRVKLTPAGKVDDIAILSPLAAYAGFEHAVENAINATEPFPISPNKDVYEKNFKYITFIFSRNSVELR